MRLAGFAVRYGALPDLPFNATGCTVSNPHVAIVCVTGPGTGRGHAWQVRVAGQWSPPHTQDFGRGLAGTAYSPPLISSFDVGADLGGGLDVQSFATRGHQAVVIRGKNFGPDLASLASVSYVDVRQPGSPVYAVNVSACDMQVPHEVLLCRTLPGAGSQLAWQMVVADQLSTNPTTGCVHTGAQCRPPGSLSPCVYKDAVFPYEAPNTSKPLTGHCLGSFPPLCTDSHSSLPPLPPPPPHTHAHFFAPNRQPACVAASLRCPWCPPCVRVRSYAPPYVSAVVPVLPSVNVSALSTDGGQQLLLIGDNFGPPATPDAGYGFLQSVTYGVTGTEYRPLAFSTLNHTHVLITTAPGVGQRLVVVVTVGGQSSLPSAVGLGFAQPAITALLPVRGDTKAAVPVLCTVVGTNFGLLDPTAGVFVRARMLVRGGV